MGLGQTGFENHIMYSFGRRSQQTLVTAEHEALKRQPLDQGHAAENLENETVAAVIHGLPAMKGGAQTRADKHGRQPDNGNDEGQIDQGQHALPGIEIAKRLDRVHPRNLGA
mgnify:CR=1 FL=1